MVLSKRQKDIYAYVVSFHNANQLAPTMREVQSGLDLSSISVVAYNMRKLEAAGLLTHNPSESRSWRPTTNTTATTLSFDASNAIMVGQIKTLLRLCEAMLPGSDIDIREAWRDARKTITELRQVYGE